MPSSSSHGSGSHSSRSTGEEPKRRKRYSLRIEFLDDDDDDIELDGRRETTHRRRRSNQGSSSSQRVPNGQSENPQETIQRSRRASASSTSAVVGSGNRSGPPPPPVARPPSARGWREGTRSHASHTGQRGEPRPTTVEQLSQDFAQQVSVRDRSDAGLSERFQRQMSLGDREPTAECRDSRRPGSRKPSCMDAYTQTDLRGLGWSTLNLPHRSPAPASASLHPPHSNYSSRSHPSAEAALREAFQAGVRSVTAQQRTITHLSPLIPPARSTTAAWPTIQPPRPIPRQPTPIPPAARSQRSASRSGTQHREGQGQPKQRSLLPRWFSHGGREPSRGRDREPR